MICHFRNLFVNIQSLLIADFILDEFHIFPPLSKYCIFVSVTHYFSIHFNSSTITFFPGIPIHSYLHLLHSMPLI